MNGDTISARRYGSRVLGGLQFLFLWKVLGGLFAFVGWTTMFVLVEWVPPLLERPALDGVWLLSSILDLLGESWLRVIWSVTYPVAPAQSDFIGGSAYAFVAYGVAAACLYALHRRYGVFAT